MSAKSDRSYRCLSYAYKEFPALFDINNLVSKKTNLQIVLINYYNLYSWLQTILYLILGAGKKGSLLNFHLHHKIEDVKSTLNAVVFCEVASDYSDVL